MARRVTFNDQVGVAEVTAHLTEHARHRVRREARAVLGVEPLERLHQPEPGDLHQVVEGLAPVHEPPRDVARDPEVVLDELVAQAEVAQSRGTRRSARRERVALVTSYLSSRSW